MNDIHIHDFYRDACKILLQLYQSFPKKSPILVEDIAGPDEPDEFGLASERHQACFGTMVWLANSGYLNYAETIRQEALDQAVLSHKGFTLLTAPPTDEQELPGNNVRCLRQALKSGSSSHLEECMHALLTQSYHFD